MQYPNKSIIALKKTFRLPNESPDPDPDLFVSYSHRKVPGFIQDRLRFLCKKIDLKEYGYGFYLESEDEMDHWYSYVDISDLKDDYYFLVEDGTYDTSDYTGWRPDEDVFHKREPFYKRFGNTDKRIEMVGDDLILLRTFFGYDE